MTQEPASIGSVIGRLESITVHGALKAGLWAALGGHRVEVQFTRDQKDAVQSALDKRVEVSGFLGGKVLEVDPESTVGAFCTRQDRSAPARWQPHLVLRELAGV